MSLLRIVALTPRIRLSFLMKYTITTIRPQPKEQSMRKNGMNSSRNMPRNTKKKPKSSCVSMRRDFLKDGKRACLSILRTFNSIIILIESKDPAVASRKLSETALSKLVEVIPELVGGSADLTGSNLTRWKGAVDFQPVYPFFSHTKGSPPPSLVTGPDDIFAMVSANMAWKLL